MCVRYSPVPGDRLLGPTLRLKSVLSHRLSVASYTPSSPWYHDRSPCRRREAVSELWLSSKTPRPPRMPPTTPAPTRSWSTCSRIPPDSSRPSRSPCLCRLQQHCQMLKGARAKADSPASHPVRRRPRPSHRDSRARRWTNQRRGGRPVSEEEAEARHTLVFSTGGDPANTAALVHTSLHPCRHEGQRSLDIGG